MWRNSEKCASRSQEVAIPRQWICQQFIALYSQFPELRKRCWQPEPIQQQSQLSSGTPCEQIEHLNFAGEEATLSFLIITPLTNSELIRGLVKQRRQDNSWARSQWVIVKWNRKCLIYTQVNNHKIPRNKPGNKCTRQLKGKLNIYASTKKSRIAQDRVGIPPSTGSEATSKLEGRQELPWHCCPRFWDRSSGVTLLHGRLEDTLLCSPLCPRLEIITREYWDELWEYLASWQFLRFIEVLHSALTL